MSQVEDMSVHVSRGCVVCVGYPQSSCSFSPITPAFTCASSASGSLLLPFPVSPMLTGMLSVDCSIIAMSCGLGVHVVALVPLVGPVPPPTIVVTPLASAVSHS